MTKCVYSIDLNPRSLLSVDQDYTHQALEMGFQAVFDVIDTLGTPDELPLFKKLRGIFGIVIDDTDDADDENSELTHKELAFAVIMFLVTIFSLIGRLLKELVQLQISNQELNFNRNKTPDTSNQPPRTDMFGRTERQKCRRRHSDSQNDHNSTSADDNGESKSDSKSQIDPDTNQNSTANVGNNGNNSSNGSEKTTEKNDTHKETEEERAARLNKEKSLDYILSGKKEKKSRVGHKGHGCKLPDNTIIEDVNHYPEHCQNCPHLSQCLENKDLTCFSTRHEFDIEITFKHTRHKGYRANKCLREHELAAVNPSKIDSSPDDSTIEQTTAPEILAGNNLQSLSLQGNFPYGINSSMQYGPKIKSIALLQHCFCFTSICKSSTMLTSYLTLAHLPRTISKGTIVNWIAEAGNALTETNIGIKRMLFLENLVCTDETGTHVDGDLWWIHVACNDVWSYFYASSFRGQEGMKAGDFLEWYEGIVESDFWKSYWKIGTAGLIHAICCAHLCRELLGIYLFFDENTEWAGDLIILLINMKRDRDTLIAEGKTSFPAEVKQSFYAALDNILASAVILNPIVKVEGKKGRPAKGKVRALIDRIIENKEAVCRFVENFEVPFTNNESERSFRPLQQMNAISGGFRSDISIVHFLKVWSFLSSCLKQKIDPLLSLISVFQGKPTVVLFPDGIPEEPDYVGRNRKAAEIQAKLAEEVDADATESAKKPCKKASAKKEEEKTQREKTKEKKYALWDEVDKGCDYSELAQKYLPGGAHNQTNQVAM